MERTGQPTQNTPDPQTEPSARGSTSYTKHFFIEAIKIALVSVLIVLPVRIFIAQPFIVSGSSMQPTFDSGDYLVIDQLSYRLDNPERQDVIVFHYPENPDKYFIKRIIGLPGETVTIQDGQITIVNEQHPNGFTLEEPYLSSDNRFTNDELNLTLGEDEYFVLGDNRNESSDSRTWGELPRNLVVGQVLTQLLPITEISLYPGRVLPGGG